MRITQVKDSITNLYDRLVDCDVRDIKVISETMLDLEHILLNKSFDLNQENELTKFMEYRKMLSIFQDAYEKFETNLETLFAKQIIQAHVGLNKKFKQYLLYDRFVTLLTNEIDLAHITKKDKVLFIGSGPIPITAILIHQLSGSLVDCVEKNSFSAKLSIDVIGNLGYAHKITVINNKGEDVDYSDYSIILVALLAKPKNVLLKSIWDKAKKGSKVICRTSDLCRQAFYEKTEDRLFNKYKPLKKIFACGDQTISSILLIT